MLSTDFRPGSPNWLDLGSPDTGAAAAFYGAVLGWAFESGGPPAGGGGVLRPGRENVGGRGPRTPAAGHRRCSSSGAPGGSGARSTCRSSW